MKKHIFYHKEVKKSIDNLEIYHTDFYCPFKAKDGEPDLEKVVFEFVTSNSKFPYKVEDTFKLSFWASKRKKMSTCVYLILSIKATVHCSDHFKDPVMVRALLQGHLCPKCDSPVFSKV